MFQPMLDKVSQIITNCKAQDLTVGMECGTRSFAEQDALYAQGRTAPGNIVTNAKGGMSWHNYGLAADIVFIVNGEWSWANDLPWKELGEIGKFAGCEWGGDWTIALQDIDHFQLTGGLTIEEALAIYNQRQNVLDVWQKVAELLATQKA